MLQLCWRVSGLHSSNLKGLPTALLWLQWLHSVLFFHCTNARQTQVHSAVRVLFPFQWSSRVTKSLQITHHFPRTVLLSRSAGTLQLLWVWRQRFIILRRPLPRWLVAGSPAVSTLFGWRVWVVFGLSCYRSTALHSFSLRSNKLLRRAWS